VSGVDERLENLEVKVAFQEDLLAKLDEVLTALRDEVEELRRELGSLRDTVERQSPDPPEDEPPPHY